MANAKMVGWVWDEVRPRHRTSPGLDCWTKSSKSFDWSSRAGTVYVPLLGRETELSSSEESDV